MESGGPKLLDRVRDAIRARHYSRRTEVACVAWIRRYIVFHRKAHPSTLGAAAIAAFLTWLATRQRVSASTQNQALAARLFLYERVLHMSVGPVEQVVRAKQPVRLPVVLSRDEVERIMDQLRGPIWIVVALLYGAGLRLRDCLELRVEDIDCERNQIVVRRGKGQKDRRTILPLAVTDRLQAADWAWQFVFPAARICRDPRWGPPARYHLHESVVQKTITDAVRRAGVTKRASAHTFRPVLPRTYWKTATTSARCRSCSGTGT